MDYITVPVASDPTNGASFVPLVDTNTMLYAYPGGRVVHRPITVPEVTVPEPVPCWHDADGLSIRGVVSVAPALLSIGSLHHRVDWFRINVSGRFTYRGSEFTFDRTVGRHRDGDPRWTRFSHEYGEFIRSYVSGRSLGHHTATFASVRDIAHGWATDYADQTIGWRETSALLGFREAIKNEFLELTRIANEINDHHQVVRDLVGEMVGYQYVR